MAWISSIPLAVGAWGSNIPLVVDHGAFIVCKSFTHDLFHLPPPPPPPPPPVAPPSKPSTPEIVLRTTQSFTITFSVLFGSSEITRFLINITDQDGSETQTDVAVTDLQFVEELVEVRSAAAAGDAVIGYEARLVILGLENRRSYVFQVAAVNSVGTGEFSDTSSSATLGELVVWKVSHSHYST